MKFKRLLLAGNTAIWFGMAVTTQAQITLNYDFTPTLTVIDNGQVSSVQTLGGFPGLTSITNVVARLNLTSGSPGNPMFLGDLYSSLTYGQSSESQRTAVLLNRPGRDNTNAFGSSLSSLNVTLDDSVSHTNVWATTTGTGTYNSDGRLGVNPNGTAAQFLDADRTKTLAALNGAPLASNRVSLLVADFSQGGVATLAGWGVSVTGTAAASGTFTPGANASISDSAGTTNTVGAILSTTGANAGALTINLAGTTTFSNGVTGSAGITKTGAGTLILGATSDYSGATSVSNGTLLVNGNKTGSGTVTVAGGATLGGTGSIYGPVIVNGILSPGASIESLSSGDLTLNTESTVAYEMNSSEPSASAADLQIVNGNLTLNGHIDLALSASAFTSNTTTLSLIQYTGSLLGEGGFFFGATALTEGTVFSDGSNNWRISYASETGGLNFATSIPGSHFITLSNLTAIPEPGSWLALGSLVGSGVCLRRRK